VTGFARLADPEDLRTSIAVEAELEFNEDCRFGALAASSDQVGAISEYQSENDLLVYYQFYNPWSVPTVQRIPLASYGRPSGELTHGVRVLPASQVHELLGTQVGGHQPTLRELGTIGDGTFTYGWPLEYFAGELFLKCHEGSPFETIGEDRIQNLFYRRSGPISAAIAITVEEPVDQGAA
jgi:hypothetical protein